MHNRIWPNERNRKPLWADFIPEDKVKEWIEEEQASSTGRGAYARRWEIVYDDQDGDGMKAMLHEVGSGPPRPRQTNITSSRTAPSTNHQIGQGVQGAPTGPRGRAATKPAFLALDQLFSSTNAKPKLYFQPVSKELAERRQSRIDAATSKNYRGGRTNNGELKRYTFENGDELVDRGPELIPGIRPTPGQRGRGGYRGGRNDRRDGWSGHTGGHGGSHGDSWARR
jgi:hypothetical protein